MEVIVSAPSGRLQSQEWVTMPQMYLFAPEVLILVFSEGGAARAGVRDHIIKGVNSLLLPLLPPSSPVV